MVDTFKMLAQAYEELSVIKMQRVRSSVLSTRDFLEDLSEVFADVKASYQHEINLYLEKGKNKKKFNPINLISKKNKTVAVLLSANTKLYGDIIKRVFHLFVEDIRKNDFDIVIVGRHGKELFDQVQTRKKYEYFDLPDTGVDFDQLKPILEHIMRYEKVNIYYGKFMNVILQSPTVTNVTGEESLSQEQKEDTKETKKVGYIFEPSIDTIFSFFLDQVMVSLFKQTVHEAELSRLASRITAMEQALGNIEQSESQLKGEERKIRKLALNKKQIDSFAGISFWQGRK